MWRVRLVIFIKSNSEDVFLYYKVWAYVSVHWNVSTNLKFTTIAEDFVYM